MSFAILTFIHGVPPLDLYDTPFKCCLIFIIIFVTCVPVVMVCSSISLSKVDPSITVPTCSSISTRSYTFYFRVLIAFLYSISFTNIYPYVVCYSLHRGWFCLCCFWYTHLLDYIISHICPLGCFCPCWDFYFFRACVTSVVCVRVGL